MTKILNMRLIAASMLCAIASFNGFAQKPSYNHDAAKMNQITVMETGAGALTPIIYYRLLHNNYQKSAAAKNKLGFRSLAGIGAYQQIEYADSIEAYLKARAEIEALNIASLLGKIYTGNGSGFLCDSTRDGAATRANLQNSVCFPERHPLQNILADMGKMIQHRPAFSSGNFGVQFRFCTAFCNFQEFVFNGSVAVNVSNSKNRTVNTANVSLFA